MTHAEKNTHWTISYEITLTSNGVEVGRYAQGGMDVNALDALKTAKFATLEDARHAYNAIKQEIEAERAEILQTAIDAEIFIATPNDCEITAWAQCWHNDGRKLGMDDLTN